MSTHRIAAVQRSRYVPACTPIKKGVPALVFRGGGTPCFLQQQERKRLRFLYFAAPQAAGANLHTLNLAINLGVNAYEIWSKFTLGQVVCMTDVVADHATFAADFTLTGHSIPP